MNAVIKNHFLLYSGVLVLILSIPFVGLSYSNNSPSTEVERSDTTRTNIEATPAERNRLETTDDEYRFSVYGEANICDGVTCPDGSCAATIDECVVAATATNNEVISDSIGHAAAGDQIGEILKTHACPIHGYNLIIARPAGYSAGASERVIQVEKTNRFFNATWNEVENLISNYPPNELEYNQLPQNPGPGGERYCNRNNHMIPTGMNVYQVSLAHYNNYTGQTSIFADSNLEVAPLISVLHAYNQHRVFGDELPPTCNYGCMDGSSGVIPDENSWDDMNFGEIDWGTSDPRNPANDLHDGIDPGVGGQDGSVVDTDYAERRVDGDGVDLGEPGNRAQNHNSSRSNRTSGAAYADPDLDTDQSQVEWQMRTEQNDEDSIDEDDIVFAQDYNSTRSNRRKNEFFNPDDAEDDESGVATVSAERLATIVNDPPNVRCGAIAARTDEEGKLYCWGSGVRAAAIGEGDEDGNLATSTRVLRQLSVRGEEIRAWSEQERTEFRRYSEISEGQNTPEATLTAITNLVLENDRIRDLEVAGEETQMTYRAEMRLFGVVPIHRDIAARASADGLVKISYPWYRFLARTPDTNTIESVLRTVRNSISDHRGKGGGSGKVSI